MDIVLPEGANKEFSIGDAYRFGWQTTIANLGFLIGFMIIMGIVQYFPALVPEQVQQENATLSLILGLISWVLSTIVGIGYLKMGLRLANGEKGSFSDLYAHWRLFLRFFLVSVLSGLAAMGGCLLLIIPGIIIAVRLQFAPYLLVDQNTGIMESIKKSWKMTKGVTLKLFAFGMVATLILFAGFLCLLVGLLFAVPTVLIASMFVYKKILAAGV